MPDGVPEEMSAFFDARAEGYDVHMRETVERFDEFYRRIASPIRESEEALEILDLGVGTGLDLSGIPEKAPHAQITAVDVSAGMLELLRKRFASIKNRVRLVHGSYLAFPFGEDTYDYVISVMSLHHLLFAEKIDLYRRIRTALKPAGAYIEGDYIVSEEEASRLLSEYQTLRASHQIAPGSHHIDIPFSARMQKEALRQAGFRETEVIFSATRANVCVAWK